MQQWWNRKLYKGWECDLEKITHKDIQMLELIRGIHSQVLRKGRGPPTLTRTWRRAPPPGEPRACTRKARTRNGRRRWPKQQILVVMPRLARTRRQHPGPSKGPEGHVITVAAGGCTQKAKHAPPRNKIAKTAEGRDTSRPFVGANPRRMIHQESVR